MAICASKRVRGFQLENIKEGPNFLSWREDKTIKLGDYCEGTTNGDTLVEARISYIFS
jgi:hypothetical protein